MSNCGAPCASTHFQRIGIMGGTFDPIHLGHLCCAEQVKCACGLDLVLFMPAGSPAFKQHREVTSASNRLTMCELAVASNPDFVVSTLEVDREGITYTVDTLRELREIYGPTPELCLIMGADAAAGVPLWKSASDVAELATLLVVERPGSDGAEALRVKLAEAGNFKVEIVPAPLLDISSTDLRNRISAGETVRYLIPDDVRDYINKQGLYSVGEG